MRLALVSRLYPRGRDVGGSELQLSLLADGMAKRGHDVRFVAMESLPAGAPDWVVRDLGEGLAGADAVVVRDVSLLTRVLSARGDARVAFNLAKDTDTGPLARSSAFRYDLRTTLRHLAKKFVHDRGVAAMRRCDLVIAQHEGQARRLDGRCRRVAVVPNMLPDGGPGAPWPRGRVVLWVGKRWKGFDAFVRLAEALRSEARFVAVGVGEPSGRVEALGRLSFERCERLFDGAYLYVNTSPYEGFPNTFLQAWRAQVPVVAMRSDPDGSLGCGECGLLASDESALTSAVSALLADPARAAAMGERARARYLDRYLPERVVGLYEALLASA